jgi:hypothetical protein
MLDAAKITKPMHGLYAKMAAVHDEPWSLNKLMVRFQHLHPLAAYSIANVGIKKTTSSFLI